MCLINHRVLPVLPPSLFFCLPSPTPLLTRVLVIGRPGSGHSSQKCPTRQALLPASRLHPAAREHPWQLASPITPSVSPLPAGSCPSSLVWHWGPFTVFPYLLVHLVSAPFSIFKMYTEALYTYRNLHISCQFWWVFTKLAFPCNWLSDLENRTLPGPHLPTEGNRGTDFKHHPLGLPAFDLIYAELYSNTPLFLAFRFNVMSEILHIFACGSCSFLNVCSPLVFDIFPETSGSCFIYFAQNS